MRQKDMEKENIVFNDFYKKAKFKVQVTQFQSAKIALCRNTYDSM